MNSEIIRLNLPRGVWQQLTKDKLPFLTQVDCSYPDHSSVHFELLEEKKLVAKFTLSFLQGCKGVLVSHNMLVSNEYQGRGIAKKLQSIKDKVAKDLQVSVLLATVKEDNVPQQKVLRKDWKQISTFTNTRTGNKIGIHIKSLNQEDDPRSHPIVNDSNRIW